MFPHWSPFGDLGLLRRPFPKIGPLLVSFSAKRSPNFFLEYIFFMFIFFIFSIKCENKVYDNFNSFGIYVSSPHFRLMYICTSCSHISCYLSSLWVRLISLAYLLCTVMSAYCYWWVRVEVSLRVEGGIVRLVVSNLVLSCPHMNCFFIAIESGFPLAYLLCTALSTYCYWWVNG